MWRQQNRLAHLSCLGFRVLFVWASLSKMQRSQSDFRPFKQRKNLGKTTQGHARRCGVGGTSGIDVTRWCRLHFAEMLLLYNLPHPYLCGQFKPAGSRIKSISTHENYQFFWLPNRGLLPGYWHLIAHQGLTST